MTQGASEHNPAPRAFPAMLSRIAAAAGDRVDLLGGGWIMRFTRAGEHRHAWGFNLELNSSPAHLLACDKGGAAEILSNAGIPHVPHHVFLHPRMGPYAAKEGHWRPAFELFERCGRDVVVKDNNGTGGVGVYRATTPRALEAAFLRLFQRVHALCVSPFVEIVNETRFILLDGECLLAFEKCRPSVTGDGTSSVANLAARDGLDFDPETAADAEEILAAGATRLLSWRHNLGKGARASEIDPSASTALKLARDAAAAINLRFGSVDVVRTSRGDEVLEINAGVMTESVARQLHDGETRARAIYAKAYERMWTS